MMIGFHCKADRMKAVDCIRYFGQGALDVGERERRPESKLSRLALDEIVGEVVALARQLPVECLVVGGEVNTR